MTLTRRFASRVGVSLLAVSACIAGLTVGVPVTGAAAAPAAVAAEVVASAPVDVGSPSGVATKAVNASGPAWSVSDSSGPVAMVHDGSPLSVSRLAPGTSIGTSGLSGVHPDTGSSPAVQFQGPDWAPQLPLAAPGYRTGQGMAYDSGHNVDVMFGGFQASGGFSNDTWTWNGVNWTQKTTSTQPSARVDMAMAYDPALSETILYGGEDASNSYLADTWAWNGTSWSVLSPSTNPGGLSGASMVYDSALGKLVLFGGNDTGTIESGTWTFDGTTWTQLSPATSPPARNNFSMAYDASASDVVLFGGSDYGNLDDTWTFNGTTWSEPSAYASPVALQSTTMAYDSALGGVVLFGGEDSSGNFQNTSYFWNASTVTWEAIYNNTDPAIRAGMTAVVAAGGNGQIVVFGGGNSSIYFNDTQIFDWTRNGSSTGDNSYTVSAGDHNSLAVDLGTGNLYAEHPLWDIANTGLSSSDSAFYNSLGGYGFDSVLANVSLLPNGSVLANFVNGTNGTLIFQKAGTGSCSASGPPFCAPPGSNMALAYNSGAGTYTLTFNKSQTVYTFNATSLSLTSIKDRNGNTISVSGEYVADNRGRNVNGVNTTSGGYAYTTWSDSASSRTWVEVTPSGGTAPTSVEDAAYDTTQFNYNGSRQLTMLTDPDGNEITVGYDMYGRVDSVTQVTNIPAGTGPTTTFTFQAVPAGTTVPTGTTADYEVVETDPNGHATTYVNSYSGQTLTATDANGHMQSSTYSANRDPMALTNGLTQTTTLSYDLNNNPSQASAPPNVTGNTAATGYQSFATPTTGSGAVSGGAYLPSSGEDANGNCASSAYDAAGNQMGSYSGLAPTGTSHNCNGVTSGTGSVTSTAAYQGDPGVPSCAGKTGQVCTTTAGAGGVTTYAYDSYGQLTSVTGPGGSCTGTRKLCTSYTYDADSRIATVTDGKNQVTTYSYDADDRATQILYNGATTCTYSAGTCVGYGYDNNGNLTTRTDVTGTTTYVYDALNRPTKEELPSGANACSGSSPAGIVYAYDAANNLVSYCDAGGAVTYAFDPANRMVGVATGSGSCTPGSVVQPCTVYAYNNAGQLTSVTYPTSTGVVETYTLNGSGDITAAAITGGTTTAGTYSYNWEQSSTVDRPVRQTMLHNAVTSTYSYNKINQLLGSSTGTTSTSQAYTYDADGNLKTENLGGTTHTMAYTAADQLCWAYTGTSSNACGTTPTGATTYTYDADGNQTASSAGLALAYNSLNQATSMTNAAGGSSTAMSYAGVGNSQRTAAGSTTSTNNSFGIASTTTAGATSYYTRDPSGTLTSMLSAGSRYYYLYDGAGNVLGLINSSGSQVATYSYDPYGNTTASGTLSTANPYRYQAGYNDPTGYVKFGARYYSPTLGAWTQVDPSEINAGFSYAGSNPVNESDPTGYSAGCGTTSGCFSPFLDTPGGGSILQCVGAVTSFFGAGISFVGSAISAIRGKEGSALGAAGSGVAFFGRGISSVAAC